MGVFDDLIIEHDLYILQESNIVRTGRLKYYDPLKMSDIFAETLSTLNIVNDTLPSTGSYLSDIPSAINCAVFSIQLFDSGSVIVSKEV